MKVLQVLYSGLGGHGSVVTSLINADKNNEWEHCLLFYGIEDLLPAYRNFCEQKKIPYQFIKKEKGIFRSSGSKVRKVMKKFDPDAIILHSSNLIIPAWWFAVRRKKKIFEVEHTPPHVKSIGERIGTFFSVLLARKVICLTSAYKLHLKKKISILPVEKKTAVIPNGIDLHKFYPINMRSGNDMHFGMISRFSYQKNQKMIIEAIEKIEISETNNTKMHFHFAGIGENLHPLKREVSERKLEEYVHFHGLLDENGIIDFLRSLDVYIHASYAETMCTAVMQAMASGLPVIGSNISGINNLVQDKVSGLLFENDSAENLVQCIEQLSGDKQKRLQMGINARKYAEENFSSVETFHKYNQLLKVD